MKTILFLSLFCMIVVAEENQSLIVQPVSSWHVVVKDGVPECVPPVRKHRKRVARKPAVVPTPVIITKEVVKEVTIERLVEAKRLKNRFRLMGGMAPYMGGTLEKLPFKVTLGVNYLPAAGVGYDRMISDRFSLGAAVLTNASWLLSVGYDF